MGSREGRVCGRERREVDERTNEGRRREGRGTLKGVLNC